MRFNMICDVCGKNEAKIIHVSKSYGKGENLLIVENVPVISCLCCGVKLIDGKNLT
ncbi:MAG: YgiT-type zinc finger protein [Acidobacteriota bacterium]